MIPKIKLIATYGSEKLALKTEKFVLPCYIISDNTHILLLHGIQNALGYDGKNERWLSEFIESISKFTVIPSELLAAVTDPICFYANVEDNTKFEGIEAILITPLLELVIAAKENGFLSLNQIKFGRNAQKLQLALSKIDLHLEIGRVTGFEFFKVQVKKCLQKFMNASLSEPIFLWIESFPDHFLQVLFEIYTCSFDSFCSTPHKMANTLLDVVFCRLPNEIIDILQNSKPKRNYRNLKGTQIERIPLELNNYFTTIIALSELSGTNKIIFSQLLNRKFPKVRFKDFLFAEIPLEVENHSVFDEHLLKGIIFRNEI